jgi:hypothetical protein
VIALQNQVVVQTVRESQDPSTPVISVNTVSGKSSAPVFGVVKSVGSGDLHHPDIPELLPGSVVLWDWMKRGPSVVEHGQPYTLISFNSLLCRIDDFTLPTEHYSALLDLVMTEYSPLAMQRAISSLGIILPDQVSRDGLQSDANSPTACVFERVHSVGGGIMFPGRNHCAVCRAELRRVISPEVAKGDLVAFNPLTAESVGWRRRGVDYRFTPWSEIRAKVEE